MPEKNLEIVRAIYEVMNERDTARGEELTHPDLEWTPDTSVGEGRIAGREAVFAFFSDRASMFEGVQVEVERLFDAGDKVVAFIRIAGHGQASGAEFDLRTAQLWVIQEGVIVRGEAYRDRQEALRAAGIGS